MFWLCFIYKGVFKTRNGEMTFLNNKNKWLTLFCRVQLLFLCLLWTGKTLLSMLMQNLTNLVVPKQLSQSLVLSRTKDPSSPQGLQGFVSFCFCFVASTFSFKTLFNFLVYISIAIFYVILIYDWIIIMEQ